MVSRSATARKAPRRPMREMCSFSISGGGLQLLTVAAQELGVSRSELIRGAALEAASRALQGESPLADTIHGGDA